MHIAAAAATALAIGLMGGSAWAADGYAVVGRIAGPDGGWDYLRVDPGHNQLLVPRGGAVMTVNLATGKVATGLAPGGRQHVALPLPGGHEMLVTNGATNTAVFADELSGAVIASVPVAKGPDAAALDAKTGLVVVAGHAGGAVTLVDPRTRHAVGDIQVGGTLEEVATDGHGRAFVNVEDRNEVAAIDIAARKTVAHWPLAGCDGPTGLAYDPQDRLLIVACDGATVLLRPTDGKLLQTLKTGRGADGAAYDARRHRAFVPAGRDGTLSVIAVEDGRASLVQTLVTERGARTLAVDERTGRVYLPTAEYRLSPDGGRPAPVAGSFHVLVVAPR